MSTASSPTTADIYSLKPAGQHQPFLNIPGWPKKVQEEAAGWSPKRSCKCCHHVLWATTAPATADLLPFIWRASSRSQAAQQEPSTATILASRAPVCTEGSLRSREGQEGPTPAAHGGGGSVGAPPNHEHRDRRLQTKPAWSQHLLSFQAGVLLVPGLGSTSPCDVVMSALVSTDPPSSHYQEGAGQGQALLCLGSSAI